MKIKLRPNYLLIKKEVKLTSGIVLSPEARENMPSRWVVKQAADNVLKEEPGIIGKEIYRKAMCDFFHVDEDTVIMNFDDVIGIKED